MAENELPNEGDDINQSGSFGVGDNKGNIHAQTVAGTVNVYNQTNPLENHLTPREYRNRQALLTKVNNFWVKGVLEKSLHNQVLIELGLEERPDAIINSWNAILETGESSPQSLPQGTKIIDVFDDIGAGRTLLILGEPGSGKTTTLLELTRDLIARAQQDTKQLIPVVFNLSSWAKKRQKIEDWLTEELGNKYDVPKKIRECLVKEQQLLPLLDGLDEVNAQYRDDCLVAINQFKQEYGSELVVCSRIKDYQALSNRLNFQSAVCIKLLSLEQICNYLDSLGTDLTGLKKLVAEDEVWQGLAEYPLMLNIMALAYQGVATEDLPKTDSLEEQRQKLFNTYIEKVFKRRKANQLYKQKQVIHWLVWLAQKMMQESQTVFLIEKMQPSWLENRQQKRIYRMIIKLSIWLGTVLILLSFWLIVWLTIRLNFVLLSIRIGLMLNVELIEPLIFWLLGFWQLSFQVVSGLLGLCLIFYLPKSLMVFFIGKLIGEPMEEIKTVENLQVNREKVLGSILIGGPIVGLSFGLVGGPIVGLMVWLSIGLFFSLMGGLEISEIEIKTSPNQGTWASVRNAIVVWLIVGLIGGLTGGLIVGFIGGLIAGLIGGLIAGLNTGGKACIKHFALRLVFYLYNNYIPWNYARFLDYAADRILLQKVGGGYIFIHRMLMEHFAEMSLD